MTTPNRRNPSASSHYRHRRRDQVDVLRSVHCSPLSSRMTQIVAARTRSRADISARTPCFEQVVLVLVEEREWGLHIVVDTEYNHMVVLEVPWSLPLGTVAEVVVAEARMIQQGENMLPVVEAELEALAYEQEPAVRGMVLLVVRTMAVAWAPDDTERIEGMSCRHSGGK